MSSFLQDMNEEAREAHDGMVKLFLTQRSCVHVNACYSLLPPTTQAYLNAIRTPLM